MKTKELKEICETAKSCGKYEMGIEALKAQSKLQYNAIELAAEVLALREREKVLVDALATARNALDLSTTHRNEDRNIIVDAQHKIIAALMTNAETED